MLTTFCSHSLAGSVNTCWSVQVQRLELRKLLRFLDYCPPQVRQAVSKLIVFTAHFASSDPASPIPACLSNIPVEVGSYNKYFINIYLLISRSRPCLGCRITCCWPCWRCSGWRCRSMGDICLSTSVCSPSTPTSEVRRKLSYSSSMSPPCLYPCPWMTVLDLRSSTSMLNLENFIR